MSEAYLSADVINFTSKKEKEIIQKIEKEKKRKEEEPKPNYDLTMDSINQIISRSNYDFYLLSDNNETLYFARIDGTYYKLIDDKKNKIVKRIKYEAKVSIDNLTNFRYNILTNSNILFAPS